MLAFVYDLKQISEISRTYTMPDEISRSKPLDEDDRNYLEELRSMSGEKMLAHTRQMRDELRANEGKLARARGLSDEYLDSLDESIDRLEQAIEEEQVANARLAAATRQMNAAADVYLQALDDQEDFPEIIGEKSEEHN
jgi:hypothetical protein